MRVFAEPGNNCVYAVAASDFGQPHYEVHGEIRPNPFRDGKALYFQSIPRF